MTKDWQIVLKEITKNCDMETRTAVEKHFLQALQAQRQSFIELVEEKKNGKHQLDESYEVLEELLKELRKEK